MSTSKEMKLSNLPAASCGILREASNTRPTIRIIEQNGIRAVVKDFSGNRFFLEILSVAS